MKGLVLDDSPIELMMEIDLLTKIGFEEVLGAETCSEGLKIIKDFQPNIVLCDVDMPDFSGIELLRKSENYLGKTGFIMCSVLGDPEWIVESIRAGALDYILKPVKETKIREILNKISNHSKMIIKNQQDILSLNDLPNLSYHHGVCVGLKIALQSILVHRFGFEHAMYFMRLLSKVEDVDLLRRLQDLIETIHSEYEFTKMFNQILENKKII